MPVSRVEKRALQVCHSCEDMHSPRTASLYREDDIVSDQQVRNLCRNLVDTIMTFQRIIFLMSTKLFCYSSMSYTFATSKILALLKRENENENNKLKKLNRSLMSARDRAISYVGTNWSGKKDGQVLFWKLATRDASEFTSFVLLLFIKKMMCRSSDLPATQRTQMNTVIIVGITRI